MMMMMKIMKTYDETRKRRNMKMQSKELLQYAVEIQKGKMKERREERRIHWCQEGQEKEQFNEGEDYEAKAKK